MHTLTLLVLLLATGDAEATGPFDVRGTVCDEEGQPLGEALVAVWDYSSGANRDGKVWKTRTNAEGRFQLEGIERTEEFYLHIAAVKAGYVAEQRLLPPAIQNQPIDWKLVPTPGQTFTVLAPDGSKVAEGTALRVTFRRGTETVNLHDRILSDFPLTTDADGRLKISVAPPEGDLTVLLETRPFGRQQFREADKSKDRTLRLQPVGTLTGSVAVPEGMSAEGMRVVVSVRGAEGGNVFATDDAPVAADNTFRIPAILAGTGAVQVLADPQHPLRPGSRQSVTISAGEVTEVSLPVVQAVRVTGTVLEQGSGQPIAGAKVNLWSRTTNESRRGIVTDAQGRYEALVSPGHVQVSIGEVPPPFYVGVDIGIDGQAVPGEAVVEMPPLRAPRGMERRGIVIDESGEPVAEAWVTALWWEQQDRRITTGSTSVQTDQAGRFVLQGVSSQVEIYLRADTPQAAGLEYTAVPVDSQEDIRLTVSPKGVAVLRGRVVDSQGEPVAGAEVQVNAGWRRTSNQSTLHNALIEWKLTTDAEGRFTTPQAVPRYLPPPGRLAQLSPGGYYVRATSPGLLDATVTITVGPDGDPFVIPDITLLREGRIRGRVVDRQGQPLAGARVRAAGLAENQSATATTDAAGRFELTKVHPAALFVFADHEAFVFRGQALPAEEAEVTIVLGRPAEVADDAPLVPRQPTPDETAAALKSILVPLWDKLDPKEHAYQRGEILERMAVHDPEWTLAKLSELPGPRYIVPVLEKMGRTEDVAELVGAFTSPQERCYTLVRIARQTADADRRRTLMGEAFAEVRSVITPSQRLAAMMQIAEALRDFGDEDAARRIVDENLPEIEKLEAGFYRGHIAETVALFELDKALKLCEGATDEYERDRHPGNIAHKLAGLDPEAAERVYKQLTDNHQYRYLPRVCYRMATVDLPRAEALADAALPRRILRREHTYGVMAEALATKEPDEARRLLRKAFDSVASGDPRTSEHFEISLALLRIAEKVDPAATREYFWRSVATWHGVQNRTAPEWEAEVRLKDRALLAVLLARYGEHPELAEKLVEPLYTTDKLKASQMREGVFPTAMAMIDAAKAATWLQDKYFAETKPEERHFIPQPQELMADAVSGDDEAFWKGLHNRVLHLWFPDEED